MSRGRAAPSQAKTAGLRLKAGATGLVLGLLAALSSPAAAHRALLIGVGAYPKLDPSLALAAPREDARRLAAALARAGMARSDVTLMTDADGVPPTRAAVLKALADLAATARPGEQLLVYFSGHGAQAPAGAASREEDGLDELYLLADAAGWDGGLGRVPGSIDDAELAAALDRIRMTGADVWFVADTCHAAGVYRGGDGRTKAAPAAALGIPSRAVRARAATVPTGDPPGRLAAFYAAAPGAAAVERRLPLGANDASPLSQFSYALVRALDGGRLRSLRDLAIAVNAADLSLGGDAPQPMFEGALDMPVLGLAESAPRRWLVTRDGDQLTVPAGIEEGFATGERLTLRDERGRAVAAARVTAARLGTAELLADAPPPAGALEAERGGPLDGRDRLIAQLPALATGLVVRRLEVTATLWRPGRSRACPPLDPAGAPAAETRMFDLLAPQPLGQCDVVIATIRNDGAATVDASPLYIDAAGRMIALAYLDGADVRLAPGDSRRVAVRLLSEDRTGRPLATGSERLILLAVPALPGAPRDLRGIADPSPYRAGAPSAADAGALVYRWTVSR